MVTFDNRLAKSYGSAAEDDFLLDTFIFRMKHFEGDSSTRFAIHWIVNMIPDAPSKRSADIAAALVPVVRGRSEVWAMVHTVAKLLGCAEEGAVDDVPELDVEKLHQAIQVALEKEYAAVAKARKEGKHLPIICRAE
jgi:hypothetical protein